MQRDPQVVVLEAMVRLSGADCVFDVDAIVQASAQARPVIIGKALAQHGRTDPMVRAMAKGINLPELLARANEIRSEDEK